MKSRSKVYWCILLLFVIPVSQTNAQFPIADIIKAGITRVIRAVDLKIQRLQNETIWLQNAQKTLENKMHELKLTEIADWLEKQRKLYEDYYEELWKVKSAVAYYFKMKGLVQLNDQIVREYKTSFSLFKRDRHFTSNEIATMEKVYLGILKQSLSHLDDLTLVINSFVTQMSDASRLQLLNEATSNIEGNLSDLRQFNNQNKRLSLQRAKDEEDIKAVKAFYGIR